MKASSLVIAACLLVAATSCCDTRIHDQSHGSLHDKLYARLGQQVKLTGIAGFTPAWDYPCLWVLQDREYVPVWIFEWDPMLLGRQIEIQGEVVLNRIPAGMEDAKVRRPPNGEIALKNPRLADGRPLTPPKPPAVDPFGSSLH